MNRKETGKAYLFWLIGCHYLYLGKWAVFILYAVTLAGLGLWAFIDLFRIPRLVEDYNMRVAYRNGGYQTPTPRGRLDVGTAYIFCIFGWHYAYFQDWSKQILFIVTLGGVGIWWIMDMFKIPKYVEEYNARIDSSSTDGNAVSTNGSNVVVHVNTNTQNQGISVNVSTGQQTQLEQQGLFDSKNVQNDTQIADKQNERKNKTTPEETPAKLLVGEITPFHGPDGNVRGYMFENIVYATKEQAEAAKQEKEARVFEGVVYATKAEADAARAAKEDLEARTVYGVVYETRELADKARAEKEEIEACTVDGVRYATRELAAQVRAEKEEIEACTVEGVRYATKEQADEARELASRTVDGVVYATKEEADQAARTVNGRVYMTREMAEKAKAELTDNRPEVGEIEVDQEFFKDKLEYLFDEYANKMVYQRPMSVYATNKREDVQNKLAEWLAGADAVTLDTWKSMLEETRAQKQQPMPIVDLALGEVEKRLAPGVPAEQRSNTVTAAPKALGGEPPKNVSSDTANTPSSKNSKIWGIIAVAAIVGVVIVCLPKSGQRSSSSSYTSSAQRTVTRYAAINGTNVNVRNAPSLKERN
ncbi:MAG: hypothetical protein J6E31_09050, partial [Pyramidobacter sp.]|nr:hypothetical protein [Pyramidobacter sp.]